MQLAIDVGNTETTLAFYENGLFVEKYDFDTRGDFGEAFTALKHRPEKIGISSVVPAVNNRLLNACLEVLGIEPVFIGYFSKHGLQISVSNPELMGTDLIAAAAKAVDLYKNQNIIIFDMGTTTTVSVITKDKEFVGGQIFAGVDTLLKATSSCGALLPDVAFDMKKVGLVRGKTDEAMISGAYYASLGAVRGIGKRLKREYLNAPAVMIGTGAFAHLFCDKELGAFDVYIENLVTDGIIKIMNAE